MSERSGRDETGGERPVVDAERIAALLDGRLGDRERAELLGQIDASPAAFEAYSDAVAALRELEDENAAEGAVDGGAGRGASSGASSGIRDVGGGATPIASRRRPPRRAYRPLPWLAAAAVLLIAVAVPIVRGRRTGDGGALESTPALLARVDATGGGGALPDAWRAAAWDERRGAGGALTARATAVRVGALLIDQELFANVGDAEAASRVALRVAALLEELPGGGAASGAYAALADGTPHSAADRRRAASGAEQVAGEREVRAGAWLESARVAAARRDAGFFHAAAARAGLDAVARLAGDGPEGAAARDLAARLGTAIAAQTIDWPALERTLDDLLRELGR